MYKKKLLYLLLISTLFRVVLAGILELGNDEVYYYTYALHLQASYFDHPPLIALLIRIFTVNLNFTSEIFVRSGSIYCAIIGTLLCYQIGNFIKDKMVGWYSAILYNTSIYSCIIAGTFILPDSPQIVCWLASLYMALLIVNRLENKIGVTPLQWFLFGLFNGLAIMCKVHGVFIWGGFGLYLLIYDRRSILNPGFFMALLTTVLVMTPMLYWNYQNHFITYTYHSSRVTTNHLKIDTDYFFQAVLGQLFYNSPVNVVISFLGVYAVNKSSSISNSYKRLLLLCGFPMIAVVTLMSLFNPVLPHWSGPGFLTLSFFGALYADNLKIKRQIKSLPLILRSAIIFIFIVVIAGIIMIEKYPGTIGKTQIDRRGEYDFTLDMYGWKDFGNVFNKWYVSNVNNGRLKPGMTIVCNEWFPSAHLDYYVAPLINSHVVAYGELNDIHHYAWLNRYRGGINRGEDALCIVPSNYPLNVEANFANRFQTILHVCTFTQYRSGKICRFFNIYILKNATHDLSQMQTIQ